MKRISSLPLMLGAALALVACKDTKKAAENQAVSPDMVAALVKGDDAKVKELLDAGESVTAKQNEMTALCIAAMHGRVAAMSFLVAAGADVNYVTPTDGTTPLMFAAKNGQVEAVKTLVAQGAKIEKGDKNGANALHYAIMGGSKEAVAELVKTKPELLRSTTNVGLTPLLLASNRLAQPGASPTAEDTAFFQFVKGLYNFKDASAPAAKP